MLAVFQQLLSNEAFVDITLACEGLSLKAHKMVLAACSPFFQALFVENPCKHPIVILPDMRYMNLKAAVEFMYRGELNVPLDRLGALLKTAETLKVKGLAEDTHENKNGGLVTSVDGAAEILDVMEESTTNGNVPEFPDVASSSQALVYKSKQRHYTGFTSNNSALVPAQGSLPSDFFITSQEDIEPSKNNLTPYDYHTIPSVVAALPATALSGDGTSITMAVTDASKNVPEFPDVASSSQALGIQSSRTSPHHHKH
ncbi:hypothetical protein V5799_016335 [Amblyomma americanum]|uniref:BTB domain-containing protein n=1 Tax=Amblyomma americanum TaxID=6943 RepID=A0AAQ4F6J9_AMBAM